MKKYGVEVDLTYPTCLLKAHFFERIPRVQGKDSTSAQINIPISFKDKKFVVILIPKELAGELQETMDL